MKVRIASALSFAGVLVAGSAAALVNSQVLQPASPAAGSSSAAQTITTDSAGLDVSGPATQASYRVGDAGAVLLDTTGDTLTVVSATAAAGWVVASTSAAGETVAVDFQQGTLMVTFTASFVSGVVATSVDTTQVVITAPAGGGTPGSNGSTPTTAGPGVTAPRTTVDDSDSDDDSADDDDDDDGVDDDD